MFMNLLPKESAGSIFCFICLIGCLSPSVAHAGFDWTPPPAAPAAQHAAPVPVAQDATQSGPLTPEPDALPVPVGNVESEPVAQKAAPAPAPFVAPEEAPAEPLSVSNTPEPAPAPVAESLPTPVIPAPTPAVKPTPAPPAAIAAPTAELVEGFGKDIPLVIALRDIVPAKYAYAFSPREVAGTKISWRGGKVWQDVLKDALAPHGLDVSVSDTQVVIFAKPDSTAPATPVAPIAPAPKPVAAAPAPTPAPTMSASTEPTAETLIAKRPDPTPDATDEPVPLTGSQSAQAQEKMAATAPTNIEPAATATEKPPVMAAIDMQAPRKWQARPGTTLRQTLETWTKDSNVELNWSTPYDYPINNAFYFDGTFPQAVDSLLSSYGGETPNPKGRLYPNLPEGPSVLMIN